MKKIIALLLALILPVIALTSCFEKDENSSVTPEIKTTASSESSTKATEPAQTVPVINKNIPASAKATEMKDIYTLGGEWCKNASLINVVPSGEYLRYEFVTSGMDSSITDIVMYSPSTDSVVGTLSLPEGNDLICDYDGGFAVVPRNNGNIKFYDNKAKLTASFDIDFAGVYVGSADISDDCKYMLYADHSGRKLSIYSFEEKKAERVDSQCSLNVWIRYSQGLFYFDGKHGEIFTYDAADKTVKTVCDPNYSKFQCDDYCVEYDSKRYIFTPLQADMTPYETPILNENEIPVSAFGSTFITAECAMTTVIRVRDLEKKTLSVTEFASGGRVLSAVLFNGLLYVNLAHEDETSYNYVCEIQSNSDITVVKSTEPYDRYEGFVYPEYKGSDETVTLANRLLDEYGIRVVYAEEDIKEYMNYPDFSGTAVDEATAYKAMLSLETLMRDYYPKGMFMEVTDDIPLWVYLATDLVSDDIIVAGAALTDIAIALDAKYNDNFFCAICSHELMHIIDKNVDFIWESAWINLMPEEIQDEAYYNDYKAEYDNKYTQYDNGNTDVWFFDNYARTFSTEDRARIYENLYMSDFIDKIVDGLDYNTLKMKARYISVMIRTSFETCRNAESLPWERFIGEIDMHEFDSILAMVE